MAERALSPWVSPALAFVAGFADASTFVGADGIFCAHVTGNFVVLAADLARHTNADGWLKLATFPVFVGSVLFASHLHRRWKSSATISTHALLLPKAALLALAALVGIFFDGRQPGWARTVIVVACVMAMGTQNAFHRFVPTLGPMTTVMTGNVTQWLVEWNSATPNSEQRARHQTLSRIILLFASGCAAGAFGVARLGFGVLWLPAVIVVGAWATLRSVERAQSMRS
jgi:uncharacterized membrane protein YoaK (UPF0700 family)